MILRAALAALISLNVLACGVKSDLQRPPDSMTDPRERDPSKPPRPLGQ